MAITSMRIANAASGNRVQAVEAVELDRDGNATVMERIILGSEKAPSSLHTFRSGEPTGADTFDLTAIPSDITDNLLTVGDKSMLVLFGHMVSSSGTAIVTPIAFDDSSTPAFKFILEPKSFFLPYAFRLGSASGLYVSFPQTWDLMGAIKIGVHISANSSTGIDIYGYAI